MKRLPELFANNRTWAESVEQTRPDFFKTLAKQQNPEYLWIGCSDSRVPANVVVGLHPGELFVHRNVSNLVVHTDVNCLSVIQFAVELLKVKHVIVCGHYGCGGVKAALEEKNHGLIDNWLRNIRDINAYHQDELAKVKDQKKRVNRLCELNVIRQVHNVCHTTILMDAWAKGQDVTVHGWIYDVEDGRLKDLGVCVDKKQDYCKTWKW
jgi:carbonic anhydrase